MDNKGTFIGDLKLGIKEHLKWSVSEAMPCECLFIENLPCEGVSNYRKGHCVCIIC